MTTLGDTPTTTKFIAEDGSVSIKIEQGVLCENHNEYVGSSLSTLKLGIHRLKYESSHPSDMEKDICDNNYNMLNISTSISQPEIIIKTEPDVDIDDRQPEEEVQSLQSLIRTKKLSSRIRLAQTTKPIASTNRLTDNKRRYPCTYVNCTKSYGKSSHLRSHLTWHTGIKPFVCKEPGCGKGFTRSDELNRHIRTHTGEKPFECVQCTKKFSRSDHLTKHLATHTKQLAASNNALTKKIKLNQTLLQSNLKMNPTIEPVNVKDNQCAKWTKFINKSEPQNVSKATDIITDRTEDTPLDNLTIKLENSENSNDYLITMPEGEINISPCQTQPVPAIEASIMTESNVVSKHEPLDEQHVRDLMEIYANEPDDDAIMPEANLPPLSQISAINSTVIKNKASSSQLKQTANHMANNVYDPTRPFPCCHCTKNFKRQDDLNRHMRTHTGEKPFACNECDKRFMRSDHLKKHMNTHIRVR